MEASDERRRRWEEVYKGTDLESLPWFYPELDPDFARALGEFRPHGTAHGAAVLDLCTGPGTQALALAEQGYSVTAMDIAESAVQRACLRAREQGMDITFHRGDILNSGLTTRFDAVIDRGCYHVFEEDQRRAYVSAVAPLVLPGGYLFLKCFSTRQRGTQGPHRIAPEEIRQNFAAAFEVLSVKHTRFPGPGAPEQGPQALFCIMRRREDGEVREGA